MNRERRRLMRLAALASSTLGLRRAALSTESGVPLHPADPAHPQEPSSNEALFRLDAHLRLSAAASGTDSALSYGEPGPVLRLRKNAETRIRLTNGLPEATSLDWHGMRLPNALEAMPGLTGGTLAPGGVAEFALRPLDGGSYWFHPATIPGLSNQTANGLAGVVVVDDSSDPPVDGEKVLFLTDAPLKAAAGRIGADGPGTMSGDVLVNGRALPETERLVPGTRLRLRIINGSTRLALAVTFQGAHPLVVAIDGQPSELFAPLNNTVPIGPGARFDVVVDLPRTSGTDFRVTLPGPQRAAGPSTDRLLYLAKAEGVPRPEPQPIAPLAPNPALPRSIPLERATRADMAVQRGPASKAAAGLPPWSINGFVGTVLPKRPLFSVKRNAAVTLGLSNKSTELTAFRLHGHVMRLLHAMDDGWEPYWRDSVLVPPGATHHTAFLADNPGRWLIESPFFDQAANGLRTWFEVL